MCVGQVAAGAAVVITQPPLVWDKFETWYRDVERFVSIAPTGNGLSEGMLMSHAKKQYLR